MGKARDEQPLPSAFLDAQGTIPSTRNNNGCCLSCSRFQKLVTFRCAFVLILGVAVLLSAIFWLPFFHFGDHKKLDLDYEGHDIVASFMLKKPASFLQDHILQLKDDIFDEMSFSNTKVQIISLQPSAESNITKVVFAVESDVTTQSLIRESFVSLITEQSLLHLTEPLFGDPFSFEVLRFRGGITVSPEQKAFLMQTVQILFNFTLNFSIDQILDNFGKLTSQLNTGLHLAPYENLYIKLTNLKGSTVTPPTTVQAQVLLAVGINFSNSRLKQLTQTITHSHSLNLGLNNTMFGRVKQVRLSSIFLNGSPLPPPSPSPSQSPESHYHHHYHHRPPHDLRLSPSASPSPSMGRGGPSTSTPVPVPALWKNKVAKRPSCHFGYRKHFRGAPSKAPIFPPLPKEAGLPTPSMPPAPVESPLPNVVYARSGPPLKGEFHARSPDVMPLVSPSPSPSSAGVFSSDLSYLLLFILLVLHL